ncbi:2OG-Fe dioxygenase family protein [Dyella psychrodurans]|uniref:2OG-Fe dioxygenase family protein n=1 Tax=Dyella psychrodurans TaxID=1927960 RepID=A0A370X257_9GAMM|nr:2OG-Fe dioxygenase family protein [Dyella psychrodurans]RDS82494.1 hypothetical protein DWU99_13875 [Dyella psychrodurans]
MTSAMNSQSKILQSRAFLHGGPADLFGTGFTTSPAWNLLADSWNDLKQDEYMADGGTYRYRRYSEFQVDSTDRSVTVLPHVPYRQSREYNPLNGGIDRWYRAIREDIQKNSAFQDALLSCIDVLAPLQPRSRWTVKVFQNRIFAKAGEVGKPTPEGVHRDGCDFVLSLLIKRHNIVGGESSVYSSDGEQVEASVMLKDGGDFLFLDDQRTKHCVQPIARLVPVDEGYRDMLIAMFAP